VVVARLGGKIGWPATTGLYHGEEGERRHLANFFLGVE